MKVCYNAEVIEQSKESIKLRLYKGCFKGDYFDEVCKMSATN